MKICDLVAKWCADINTPFVAGIPASGMLQIMESMAEQGGENPIPFILTRHEQAAAMMACSYAFHSGQPAVAMASKAPGCTNLAIGVMSAFIESIPMVIITQQVSNEDENLEAFEEIDLAEFFKPITKWSVQANNPRRINGLLNEAYRRAMTGRRGPVHVAIPFNFIEMEVDDYVPPHLPTEASAIDHSIFPDITKALATAKRPLIIAGGGVRKETEQYVTRLSEDLNAPIVASWLRKPVSDAHPNLIGMAGIGGSPTAKNAISNADVVLALGCRFSEQMTEFYRMKFAPDVQFIHIDQDPAVISRVFPAKYGIVGDIKDALPILVDGVRNNAQSGQNSKEWLQKLQNEQAEYRAELDAQKTPEPDIGGREVVQELCNSLPKDSKIILDSGNYLHWAEQYYHVDSAGQFHYPTSGAMGFGIPGAMGAKIASPDSFACALVGDGGYAMTMAELETARRMNIPILVIIINNNKIGHISMRQDSLYGRRIGTEFGEQRFAKVAEAFGIENAEVTTIDEFRKTLTHAVKIVQRGSSMVIDVHVTDELAAGPLKRWWTN